MANQTPMPDAYIAEFLDLARSANVTFDITYDRLHMRMVRPNWAMWTPIRHMLDEIGHERIEAFVRRELAARQAVESWNEASVERLKGAAEVMRGGA